MESSLGPSLISFLVTLSLYSHLSALLSTYKSLPKTVVREDGVRLLRHTLDMLAEVVKLRTVEDRSDSIVSSRSAVYTDTVLQVSWSKVI